MKNRVYMIAVRDLSTPSHDDLIVYVGSDHTRVEGFVRAGRFSAFIEHDKQEFVILQADVDGDPDEAAVSVRHLAFYRRDGDGPFENSEED